MHTIQLPGNVVIQHNQDGQPAINAMDEKGAAYGQGYLAALHRFWSMEQQRRIASARLSEFAGPDTIQVDQWICRLGLLEAVDACYERIQQNQAYYTILESYTAGVNYALTHDKRCIGIEFKLTGIKPEQWTNKDTIRIITLISWSLAGNWEEQIVRLTNLAQLGPKQAAMLEVNPREYESISTASQHLLQGAQTAFQELASLLADYQTIHKQAGLLPRRSGSNAYIVGGTHTINGKPILAGDPHMPLGLPGLFYELKMQTQDGKLNALGAAIPGIPGIIIGRNTTLAWSITVAGAITAELGIETAEAEKSVKTYTLNIKGQPPYEEHVQWTANGPFLPLSSIIANSESAAPFDLALIWTGHQGVDAGTLSSIWQLMYAQNGPAVQQATQQWGGPVLNLLWAEVEQVNGAFGWQLIGTIPIKETSQEGFLPTHATVLRSKAYIPAQKLPSEITPQRGYLISANQCMASTDYPFTLSHEYMSPYRAKRIQRLIIEIITSRKYTAEDARLIQIDQNSEAAIALKNILSQAIRKMPSPTKIQQDALTLIEQWDGELSSTSAAAAIVKVTEDYLYRHIAEKLFSSNNQHQEAWLGCGFTPMNPGIMNHWRIREIFLALTIERQQHFTAISDKEWRTLIQYAFVHAIQELSQQYGHTPSQWRWGKIHKLTLLHPLIQVPVYQRLSPLMSILKTILRLSRGPYEVGGDEHTPWQTSSYPVPTQWRQHNKRLWATAYQPAYRMIAMDNGQMLSCLPGGISGHTWHAWSSNQLSIYLSGKLLPSKV